VLRAQHERVYAMDTGEFDMGQNFTESRSCGVGGESAAGASQSDSFEYVDARCVPGK
jgi:hypothetical protein